MLKDGIYAGILLAFTMSFDDFVISYFVTGRGVQNISIIVYNMTKRTNPTINALSTIVILVIALALIISKFIPDMVKNTMKKLMAVFMAVLIGVTIFTGVKSSKRTIRVFSSGEYIDMSVLDDFEEKYNCNVIYETFDSNETMYTKIMSGAEYDILVPSDYMIERLIREDYLQEIDWSKISNKDGINPECMGFQYDPENKYSVPYFYGTVGILYNRDVVDEEDLEDGWELLRNPKYKGDLYMYDSERDSFMIALKALGYSMNTENFDEIDEAYNWLIDQRDTMDVVYAGDDVIDNMISGNKSIAVVYSGDGALIMSENEDLDYFEPDEGTNEWCDAMVITNDCTDTELAHEYIDFILSYDIAYRNTEYVGYTSSVKQVVDDMAEGDYEGINAFTPEFGKKNNEVFRYQDLKVKQYFADMWTKVKAY
jgi:spermidine/putrescine transport system permease protein